MTAEKIKPGDWRRKSDFTPIQHDKAALQVILETNKAIVDMNREIAKALMNPAIVISGEPMGD